ncbi:hypothetical protein [Ralstonia phage phiRSL1]|uniref:Uncharacterized protein n=1 Tax=Ralstonia phage phiRSL1 TaxID=1980924 RepID=B2ZXP8_9CAUD|nr:hypothetical protein RSL1_ORF028 [Ralstonia phage phiRSL1]BAG41473.1 hypothetical protein [Ralstonia phage phiRSL1]
MFTAEQARSTYLENCQRQADEHLEKIGQLIEKLSVDRLTTACDLEANLHVRERVVQGLQEAGYHVTCTGINEPLTERDVSDQLPVEEVETYELTISW